MPIDPPGDTWRYRIERPAGGERTLVVRLVQVFLRPSYSTTSASTTPVFFDPGTNAAYVPMMAMGFEMGLPVWRTADIKRGAVITGQPRFGSGPRQYVVLSLNDKEVFLLGTGLASERSRQAFEHREVADALIEKRWSYHGVDRSLADEEEAAYRLALEPD